VRGRNGSSHGRRDGILRTLRQIGKGCDGRLWITPPHPQSVEDARPRRQAAWHCRPALRIVSVGNLGDKRDRSDVALHPSWVPASNMPTLYNSVEVV